MKAIFRRLFGDSAYKGDMIDPTMRTILANERTLLAWIRTALALLAGGLALTQLGSPDATHILLGVGVALVGGLMAVIGYARFVAADEAIRANRLPAMGAGPLFQVAIVLLFVVILCVIELGSL